MSTPIAIHKPGGPDKPGAKPGTPGAPAAGGPLAALKKNPTLLLAGGGAVVVALVALTRSSGTADASDGTTGPLQMTGAGSTYDSTANDLYNSIQPEIDALTKMLADLQNQMGTPKPPTTTPVTTLPGKPTTLPGRPTTPTLPGRPPVKAPVKVTKPTPKYVTIKKNNTLSGIAKTAGITMATLKKLNPVFWTNPKYKSGNMIWSGGKVRIS